MPNTVTDTDRLIAELVKVRESLLGLIGYDLFEFPKVMETITCHIGGLEQQRKTSKFDAIAKHGIKFEIKTSCVTFCAKLNNRKVFNYHNLQGSGRRGKGVDGYIFVGYRNDAPELHPASRFRFFVIPASVIGKRNHLTVVISTGWRTQRANGYKWIEFEVKPSELKSCVDRLAQHIKLKRIMDTDHAEVLITEKSIICQKSFLNQITL